MKKIIVYILIIVVFLAVCGSIFTLQEKIWNDGNCCKCGTPYNVKSTIVKGNEKILVSCPECSMYAYVYPVVIMDG